MLQSHDSAKRQLWKKRFADFDKSGLTIAQFCQSVGCSIPTFYQWRRKLDDLPLPNPQANFLRVQTADPHCSAIEIKLPSGISLFVPLSAIESLPAILSRVV